MTPHNPHALPAAFLDQPLAALPEDATDERLLLPAHPGAEPVPTSADGREPVFTRDLQTAFLQALAACGVARRASMQAGVSYRTAYRARRAEPVFRRAWDAALLAARALSEDVLATRALDGVEEEVWYHGEVVATRRRYDSRLLLAHLARLDRLTEDARTRAFAEDYEGALERFAAGEDDPAPVCADCGEALPMVLQEAPDGPGEGGPGEGGAGDAGHFAPGHCDRCDTPPAPGQGAGAGEAPFDPYDESDPEVYESRRARVIRMEDARPLSAPSLYSLADSDEAFFAIEDLQLDAFECGGDKWWLVTTMDECADSVVRNWDGREYLDDPVPADGGAAARAEYFAYRKD